MKLSEMNKEQLGRVMRAANANAGRAYDKLFNDKLSIYERCGLEYEYRKQAWILEQAWTLYHEMKENEETLHE